MPSLVGSEMCIRDRLRILKVPIKKYSKSNFKKFLYMIFGINLLKNKHVVERYIDALSFLDLKNDNKGLDYFIEDGALFDYDTVSYTHLTLPTILLV